MTSRIGGRHHFFVPPEDTHDGVVEIKGSEAHHAGRVLRLRAGESITVADGSGRVLEAVVTDVGRVVRADVTTTTLVTPPRPSLTLYQAVPKGDRMDDVVSKAVEIGVRRIVPFLAERTVVRWDERKRQKARERWTAVARAAAKQSRSSYLTSIGDVCDGLRVEETAPVVGLHEGASTRLREALPSEPPDELVVVVGPEGGLSPVEVEHLRSRGATLATLGDRILRTETAGLVAAAIIGYAYGNLA